MPRYKLTLEYHGAGFAGWQRQQTGIPSIQGALEEAFFAFSGEQVCVSGAGRTDAGVHACGQVAHVDLVRDWSSHTVMSAVNAHLRPRRIVILQAERVADDFDARFSARRRYYMYRILNRRACPGIERGLVWHVSVPLEVEIMQEAAHLLIGRHDFTTFRAVKCQARSPVKTLDAFSIERDGEIICCHVQARSFLHNQVRSMVGSLKAVGEGRWNVQQFDAALKKKERRACAALAPPEGLYLMKVAYF